MRPIAGGWKGKPGNFDNLHALDLFPGVPPYGFPALAPEAAVPAYMMAYDDWRTAAKKGKLPKRSGPSAIHFFMEDYRFEAIWNNPERTLGQLTADVLLTPDFSMYTDHPVVLQMWNQYRSRWLGAYWQRAGKKVIPTVGWSTPDSYDWSFDGLPVESVVAVSTIGNGQDPEVWDYFKRGYRAMVERLRPSLVLNYSEVFPEELVPLAPIKMFQTWQVQKLRVIDAAKMLPPPVGKVTPAALPAGEE